MTISCLVVITSLFFLSQGNHSALGVRLALRQEIKVEMIGGVSICNEIQVSVHLRMFGSGCGSVPRGSSRLCCETERVERRKPKRAEQATVRNQLDLTTSL